MSSALLIGNVSKTLAGVSSFSRRAFQASRSQGWLGPQSIRKASMSLPPKHVRSLGTTSDRDLPIPQHAVLNFIENFELSSLDDQDTINRAKNVMLDATGVVLSGTQTPCSKAAFSYAKDTGGGVGNARLWLDGHNASAPAVAMAHALTCDSVDMTDGLEQAQGHCGVVIIPSAFAFARSNKLVASGENLLEAVIVGYEVGLRAGLKLRALEDQLSSQLQNPSTDVWNKLCDSSSGAWNALGSAATSARLLLLSREQTKEALGIAEYYGPRSMMMRCIAYPTMLKDGAGLGAYAGTSAAILAKKGFTGAPAETIDHSDPWDSIGKHFMLNDQYYKKFAVCYWSQCAMQGALDCLKALGLEPSEATAEQVASVKVSTFSKAVSMHHPHPDTTEIAQYSLEFAVAAAMTYEGVGAKEITNLTNMVVNTLSSKISAEEKREYTAIYPKRRLADVEVKLVDGRTHKVEGIRPPWTNDSLPTDEEIKEKFFSNVTQVISQRRARYLYKRIMDLENLSSQQVEELLNVLEHGH